MSRQDFKIAAATLLLVAATAVALFYGKPRLGNPGLVLENKSLTNEVGKVVRTERVFLPSVVDDFVGEDSPLAQQEIDVLPPDTLFGRKLYRDRHGRQSLLSAVLMKTDRSSIHRPQTCVEGQGWQIEKTEYISIPVAKPHPYKLQATALLISRKDFRTGAELRGWYVFWFVAEEDIVARMGEAHWLLARNLLVSGTLQRWAYVSCFAFGQPGEEAATLARMKRLVSSAVPEFQRTAGHSQQTASIGEGSGLN